MLTQALSGNHTFSTQQATDTLAVVGGKRMKAIGYVRVSTDMQERDGLSLDAQQETIKNYCRAMGYELVDILMDAESGKNMTGRPEFQRMISQYIDKRKVNFIVCTNLDRFTRSQKDFLIFVDDYVKKGICHLALVREHMNTESPTSLHAIRFAALFAELERERISERVSSTIQYIRSQGGHYGKVPFGYKPIKEGKLTKLVKHPENYPWLEKMAAWYREGVNFADIARRLNDAGVKPSQSPQWTQTSVYDLLRKERIHVARSEQDTTRVYDKTRAYNLAYALKVDGRTLKFIAEKLNEAGLRPSKANHYEWYSVQELLRSAVYHDRSTAKGCAKYWKAQGLSLNEIARKLAENGHTPKRGGQWYAQTVKNLLIA
jgi:DNA invertase Pin-like site-specific DNA recombinase